MKCLRSMCSGAPARAPGAGVVQQRQRPRQGHTGRWRVSSSSSSSSSSSASGDPGDLSSAFLKELQARQAAEAAASEALSATQFDGPALLALLRRKYGRSYDVTLVRRTYMGKQFTALNIMWKYAEQASFGFTPEQHMQRLDYVAAVLRSWGVVTSVQQQLAATKERPRVGKAVSIMLDVPPQLVDEWLGSS